jgi:hypothetical protein
VSAGQAKLNLARQEWKVAVRVEMRLACDGEAIELEEAVCAKEERREIYSAQHRCRITRDPL